MDILDIPENLRRFHKKVLNCPFAAGVFCFGVFDEQPTGDFKPGDLAERMSAHREPASGLKFRLPVDIARAKARSFLNETPTGGYSTVVEQWRQLPDGQIEFTVRRLRSAD